MTETKQSIPDEVIEQALTATDLLEPEYTEDLDEGIRTAAPIIAAWARNEALREAAEVARNNTTLTLSALGDEAEVIAQGILELVKEHVTIPNPDHTPLGKYEVAD